MKFTKSASVEELQVISRFEGLRKILLSEQYADHLKKPLAYWALPTDRRLPLAFLGRTLEDLLQTPFSELSNTPGIGQKKICSFVKLLARAANTDPSELPTDIIPLPDKETEVADGKGESADGFSPASVSEVVWGQWRASVIKHGLGDEKLGRFAPTLRNMTRVIWNTPLEAYTQFNLGEIRSMKTHGEKRVRAILEVFHSVHVAGGQHGNAGPSRGANLPPPDRPSRAMDRPRLADAGRSDDAGTVRARRQPAAGAGPHRCHAADRQPGGESAGHFRTDHERSPGSAGHGADAGPGLPVAQRDQRHHGGALAQRPSPDVRASREAGVRVEADGLPARLDSSSLPPSSCSIPAIAAAPPVRWSISWARTTKTKTSEDVAEDQEHLVGAK